MGGPTSVVPTSSGNLLDDTPKSKKKFKYHHQLACDRKCHGIIRWENGNSKSDWAFHNLGTPGHPKWIAAASGAYYYYNELDSPVAPPIGLRSQVPLDYS